MEHNFKTFAGKCLSFELNVVTLYSRLSRSIGNVE